MMNKHLMYLNIAEELAKESKCVSLKVGAVLVKDDNIISTGINGTPKGSTNCCEIHSERGVVHSEWSALHEIHAEMNAILRCNVDKCNGIMYTTCSPCINCLKHCNTVGIKTFIYSSNYYRTTESEEKSIKSYCKENGIELYYFDPISCKIFLLNLGG